MKEIESDGLQLNPAAPSAPVLAQVQSLVCTSCKDGTQLLTWSKVRGATGYEVQITTMPGVSSAWTSARKVKGSRWHCPLLVEPEVWVRIRALGSSASGPWSDPILIKSRASAQLAA